MKYKKILSRFDGLVHRSKKIIRIRILKYALKQLIRRFFSFKWAKKIKLRTWIAFAIILILLPIAIAYMFYAKGAKAEWYDETWTYRKAIPVTKTVAAQTNVYIAFDGSPYVDTSTTSKFQADCGDIRFTKADGELLPYIYNSGCGTSSTDIDVFFDSIPLETFTIYMYYGAPNVANETVATAFPTEATNYTIGTAGTEVKGPGPSGYWNFDDAQGTSAKDSTLNNDDATLGLSGVGATNKIRHEINIINGEISTAGADKGMVAIPTDNYSGTTTYYFEVVEKLSSGGTGGATLTYNAGADSTPSGGNTIAISETMTNSYLRYRSSSFSTAPTGIQNAYVSALSGTGATIKAARIIAIQDQAGIDYTEEQFEIGNYETGKTNASDSALTSPKYWTYNSSNWDSSRKFYVEASWKKTDTLSVPTFISAGTLASDVSGGCSITPTPPTHQANDIILVMAYSDDPGTGSYFTTATAGWSNISRITGTGTTPDNVAWFWKRAAGAGTAGPALADVGTDCFAAAYIIRGAKTTGLPFESNATAGDVTTTSTTPTTTAITTTGSNEYVMSLQANNTATGFASGNPPSGWSADSNIDTATGTGIGLHVISKTQASAGTVSQATVGTLNAAHEWGSLTLAFLPAASSTVTIKLQEDNGTYTFSDKLTLVNAADYPTNQGVRSRSSTAFSPGTDGRHYRIVSSTASGNYDILNAKIIVDVGTPGDLSNATHTDTKIIGGASYQNTPYGSTFAPNGLHFYTTGPDNSNRMEQWDLTTAWNISTASYANKTILGTGNGNGAMFFKDSTNMYWTPGSSSHTDHRALTSAWDISTLQSADATFTHTDVPSSDINYFSPDGKNLYLVDGGSDILLRYTLGTAWDITTAVINGSSFSPLQLGRIDGIAFTQDGLRMFLVGNDTNIIYQYDLSTPWDTTTSSYNSVSLNVTSYSTVTNGMYLSPDDASLFITYDGTTYSSAIIKFSLGGSSGVTKLETEYLVMNTADNNSATTQDFQTKWDSSSNEWLAVSNTYYHVMDSDSTTNASASLVDRDTSTNLTNSTVTVSGSNQYQKPSSNAITMPTSGHLIDTKIEDTTGSVYASRILVIVSLLTPGGNTADPPTWKNTSYCLLYSCLYFTGETADTGTLVTNASPIDFDIGLAGGFTFSVWIRPNTDGEGGAGQIFNKGTSTYLKLASEGSDGYADLTANLDRTTDSTATVTNGISLNQWNFVVMTYDGSDTLKLYINGALSATDTSGSGAIVSDSNDLYFGHDNSSAGSFQGFMDEFKVYPYERSADQVKADFAARGTSKGVAATFGSQSNSFITNGLVGFWNLDETATPSADSSGNSQNGTWGATPTSTTGKFGKAISLASASSQYITITDTAYLSPASQVSTSAWINPTTNVISRSIMVKNDAYRMTTNASSQLVCEVYSGGAWQTAATGTSTLATGTWQHVACTYDGNNVRAYVNGAEDGTSIVSTSINDSAAAVEIGRNVSTNYFNGAIDDVRVYNRGLSGGEIKSLYNWAPAPVGYWPLDENTGTTYTYDKSGNGYAGSLTSITEGSWVPGKYGSALNLDGSADYVSVGTGPTVVNTVEFWINPATTSDYFINLTSTTVYVSASTGTITPASTGFTSPTVYINGVTSGATGTISAGTWQHVAVTSATSVNASTLYFGRSDTNYLEGRIDDVRLYNYTRSASQVVEDMNGGHPAGGSPIGSQVSYWNFDEMYGDTAHDLVGSNNGDLFGTCPGDTTCPNWNASGKVNGTLTYDTGDYIDLGTPSSLNLTGDFTLTGWFKLATGSSSNGVIFSSGNTNLNYWYVMIDYNDILNFVEDGGSAYLANITLTENQWYHFAVIKNTDSGNNIQFYLNNVPAGTAAVGTVQATGTKSIGGRLEGGFTYGFNGQIDELKVYNSALTSDQLKVDYNFGSAVNYGTSYNEASQITDGAPTILVGEWKLDEKTGTGASAFDTSGNGKTGTLTNMETEDWLDANQCKVGACLQFDGSNEYVDVGTGPTSVKTVAFWTYPVTTSENFMNFTGTTTAYIESSSGTLTPTGFVSPTVYINSVSQGTTGTISAGSWQFVVVTSATAVNASNLDIGRTRDANYLEGRIDHVQLYSNALTQAQVSYLYNRGRPLAWWEFDECEGATAHDATGNGHDATIVPVTNSVGTCSGSAGNMWSDGATGKRNASLRFDGNDYIIKTESLVSNYPFTMSAWIKTTSATANIFMMADASGNSHQAINLQTGNVRAVSNNGGGGGAASSPDTYNDGTWHHIAGVFATSTDRKLYIDAGLVASNTTSTAYDSANIDNWCIAVSCYNPATGYLTGQIDDVRLYNYALSESQIRKLVNDDAGARHGPAQGTPSP